MITRPVVAQIKSPVAPQPAATPQPSAAQAASSPVARRVHRVMLPDLTGLYETVSAQPGEHSAIMLQLNQAGRMLVGWFVAPPSWMPNRADTRSRSPADNRYPMPPGVLFAQIERPLVDGLQFFWVAANIKPSAPEDLLTQFMHDPTDLITGAIKGAREGQLKPTLRSGELESIYLSFDPARSGGADLSASPHVERFVRVKPTARVSNFMRQWLPKPMQEALLSEQICPLPTSFVDAGRSHLAPFDGPSDVPAVAKLIEAWRKASDNAAKKTKRSQVVDVVSAAVLDLRASATYQSTYLRQLRAHMASSRLSIGTETKSYLEWYQALLAQELDDRDALRAAGQDVDKIPSLLIDTFRRVGITPSGQYAYTFSFSSLPFHDLGTRLSSSKLIAHLGLTVFKLSIKKELVVLEHGLDGRPLLVDGKPVVKERVNVPWDSDKWFVGVFGDAGAGLSLGVKNDSFAKQGGAPVTTLTASAPEPRGAAKSKTKLSGDLGEIEFRTNISIDSLSEFEHAYFSVAAVRAPGVAVGNYVSLDLFTSKYVEFRLKSNVVLSTVQEDKLKLTPPKVPGLEKSFDLKKYREGWTAPKFSVRMFDVSMGWGVLFELPGALALIDKYVPREKSVEPPEKVLRDRGYATQEAFFAVGSAELDQLDALPSLWGITSRAVLETFLAAERVLFTTAEARMTVRGFASPEHTAQYNLDLSQRRADAVVLAIRDAFGAALQVDPIPAKGLGEEFALRNDPSLLNPPDPIGDWARRHPEQRAKWPQWRRVDLEIEGIVFARFRTAP